MPSSQSNIRSRRNRNTAYVSTSVALAFSIVGAAAQELPAATSSTLDTVEVQATRVKAEVQSPKFTQQLRDTPQSITVVTSDALQEQNAQNIQDVLKNVSGITFTSGEGNLGWGDLFTIRGFSSEQSITIDGVRDGGMSSRTDIFDLEQAEVYKGTGSVESGVSAIGGSVNLVSKSARLENVYRASAGIGSDDYRRLTADINQQIGQHSAVRVNVMRHQNEVAGRDQVDFDRYGAAVSAGFGLGTETRLFVELFHQKDENTPDGGLPILRGTHGAVMPGVSKDTWFGAAGVYTQRTRSDAFTARFEHDFSETTRLRNQFRYSRADNLSVLSPARLTAANADGSKTCSGARCAALGYVGLGGLTSINGIPSYTDYAVADPMPSYAYLRGSDYGMSKRYAITDNQTDLRTRFTTGNVQHDVATGLELYREFYGDLERSIAVPDGDMFFDLSNPQYTFATKTAVKGAGSARSRVENAGVYFNDTMTFSPQWMVQAALRFDRWKASSGQASRSDGALSGRGALVYKPVENGTFYLSYSQAAQPSAVGLTTNDAIYGSAATANFKPATSKTTELGSKWEFQDGRYSVNGAVFRTELTDSWEYNQDDTSPVRALPSKRVDGVELGIQGHISERWSLFANASYLDSEITKGVNKGAEAKNVPDWSASLWTSFKVLDNVAVSYGLQYVGERRYSDNRYVGGLNNNSSYAPGPAGVYPIYTLDREKAPSYVVQNLAARWRINQFVTANFNVNNLANKFYWSRIGASLDGFQLYGVPGAGRSYVASIDVAF